MATSIHPHPFTLPLFLLALLCSQNLRFCSCTNDTNTSSLGCIESERQALLKFKQGLTDPSGILSSWKGPDCCKWVGVLCDQTHGFVTYLSLRPSTTGDQSPLGGKISPSLLQLKHLDYLELSENDFKGIPLPVFIGSLNRLRTLKLTNSGFGGLLPPQLGNLSSLRYLDLSDNKFNGPIPKTLGNLSSLRHLHLSYNKFNGPIPKTLGNLSSLRHLHLSYNKFNGPIPKTLGKLSSLRHLHLSSNKFNGPIPKTLGKLSNLETLGLSNNSWEGVITEAHFANLTNLVGIYLLQSSTSLHPLKLNVSTYWIPPFSLNYLVLSNIQIGPRVPSWIQTQNSLITLLLSNTGISDSIPHCFWNFQNLTILDLSHNSITGRLPFDFTNCHLRSPQFPSLIYLKLRNNSFSHPIPSNIRQMIPVLFYLDLSDNFINDKIPSLMPTLRYLNLSSNLIHGIIPSSVCDLKSLHYLIFSNNHLSGEIPRCRFTDLSFLDLGSNNLTGKIPVELRYSRGLTILRLSNNSLHGDLTPLQELASMVILDVGGNNFSGRIQLWNEEGNSSLRVVRLRSNLFTGHIPPQICSLNYLQVLDLGHNRLTGSIPPCFGNLSAMAEVGVDDPVFFDVGDDLLVFAVGNVGVPVVKGTELYYTSNIVFLRSIDLSGNDLSGEIPGTLTKLWGLNILNLSMNHLTGMIPQQIGSISQLESLDLSQNHLFGRIPSSLSDLNYLNHLDFSYNNLSGRIPSGNQLQTLNGYSVYQGNPHLCGPPLTNGCPGDQISLKPPVADGGDEDKDVDEMMWFYISLGAGFIVGFGGVCGSLLLRKSWRRSYFQFVTDMKDAIYVVIVVRVRRLQRAFSKTP